MMLGGAKVKRRGWKRYRVQSTKIRFRHSSRSGSPSPIIHLESVKMVLVGGFRCSVVNMCIECGERWLDTPYLI